MIAGLGSDSWIHPFLDPVKTGYAVRLMKNFLSPLRLLDEVHHLK